MLPLCVNSHFYSTVTGLKLEQEPLNRKQDPENKTLVNIMLVGGNSDAQSTVHARKIGAPGWRRWAVQAAFQIIGHIKPRKGLF